MSNDEFIAIIIGKNSYDYESKDYYITMYRRRR